MPDVDFEYADEDSMAAELAELYSYTEGKLLIQLQNGYQIKCFTIMMFTKTWIVCIKETNFAEFSKMPRKNFRTKYLFKSTQRAQEGSFSLWNS